jgi:large subunit ribosomal protein L4
MPKVDLYTITGTKSGKIDLPKEIFAAKISKPLMVQAVRVYLSNQRRAHAKTKSRGEVARTKAKWYRQKGTGRARHGSRAAPGFVGGGVAHGPKGDQNFELKMPKRMKRLALFSALTTRFKDGEIIVVKDLDKVKPKTKEMVEALEKLSEGGKWEVGSEKLTIILPEVVENVIRTARNIQGVNLIQANLLNTYEILNGGKLIFMKESIDKLKEVFLV